MAPATTLGKRLMALRHRMGKTQMDIVRAGDGRFAQTTYSQIERDIVKPRHDTLLALAKAFNMKPAQFFKELMLPYEDDEPALLIGEDQSDAERDAEIDEARTRALRRMKQILDERPDLAPGIAYLLERDPLFSVGVLEMLARRGDDEKETDTN